MPKGVFERRKETKEDLINRFERRVKKTDSCWLWTGARNNHGYAYIRVGGKTERAHRIAYELYNGSIPAGKQVNHKCHVRNCVKPTHIYAGTQSENMMDMIKADRGNKAKGERNGSAKLTEKKVRQIKLHGEVGKFSERELAKKYDVSQSVINNILNNKSWKGVK